jgi:hypothetical protein
MQRRFVQVRDTVEARQKPVALRKDILGQHRVPSLVVRVKNPGSQVEDQERCGEGEKEREATTRLSQVPEHELNARW